MMTWCPILMGCKFAPRLAVASVSDLPHHDANSGRS